MTIKHFWTVMDSWREISSGDTALYYEAAQQAVSGMNKADIKDFRSILGGYLYHINECIWLDMACKVINGYVSDDTSLYFNLWVLAQGRQTVLDALKDPDSLASLPYIPFGHAEFEMLMALDFDETEGSWGEAETEDFEPDIEGFSASPFVAEIAKEITYKNGDRYGGFEDFDYAMDAVPEHCPKLIQRAAQEGFDWNNY